MENKQEICTKLCKALQATRAALNLEGLYYQAETELVIAVFVNGKKKAINVEADSGIAMIQDVVNHLV